MPLKAYQQDRIMTEDKNLVHRYSYRSGLEWVEMHLVLIGRK